MLEGVVITCLKYCPCIWRDNNYEYINSHILKLRLCLEYVFEINFTYFFHQASGSVLTYVF